MAQFLQLAIAPARFYLRERHDVVTTINIWAGRVHMTRQLRRNLLWWTDVPYHYSNWLPVAGALYIYKPAEPAYLHYDSSRFGWGGVLDEHFEARDATNTSLGRS
eukprot:scaffold24402_cov27-Prasinocladus_malaysianus.AAC.2